MEHDSSLLHPRDEIMQTMERIYRYRMTTTSGGNLSIRDEDNRIWISPARVDKGNLRRDDIVCVNRDDSVTGRHRPSSEFPFHRAIYEARPDIRGIVHAHPVALVAFSICGMKPDMRIFHQAYSLCGQVGFAPYALPGSGQLGVNIAEQFKGGCDSVILENHGVVVGAPTLAQAFQRFEGFEFAAKTLIKASHLGHVNFLDVPALEIAQKRRIDFVPREHNAATSQEKELRRELIEFLRRGCRQRLLISTEGSYSVRLSADSFLITPSQRDRERLRIEDLVAVDGDYCEAEKLPSRAARMHQMIYRADPKVESIVFAHPVNATAFSVTQAQLDARTIPESYIFLKEVQRIPYGVQYGLGDKPITAYVDSARPAAIVENDGVVVVGSSVLDVFDRLEVLESTAEAIINARSLGEIAPMSSNVIEELRAAFGMN